MSDFFDDLARQVAEPMPRRRAMRIMLAGVAAATIPSWRPGRAFARRRISCPSFDTPCGNRCCPRDTFCGNAATEACCGTGTTYCSGGQTETCCNPGETCNSTTGGCCNVGTTPCGTTCCFGGEYCADADKSLCCPTGQVACGTICCPAGASCANADIELCCKARSKGCEGKTTVTCCLRTAACCDGKCCGPGKRCVDGKCRRCPSGEKVCGDTKCCKSGVKCCGGQCCHPGEVCGGMGKERPEVCCPPHRVLKVPGGTACCPPGKVARPKTRTRGAACCPSSGPCDTCEDVPCLPGMYCINGSCFNLK